MIEEARGVALRRGDWKYVQVRGKQAGELYNLALDVGEQNDLAESNAALARELHRLLAR